MVPRISISIVLFCFLFSFQSYAQIKADTLFYEVQPEMINRARVEKIDMQGLRYYIVVDLKENYHSEFERLTGDNIGNFLAVVSEGEIISPSLPTIQAKISDGSITLGPFIKEERAKKVYQQILGKEE